MKQAPSTDPQVATRLPPGGAADLVERWLTELRVNRGRSVRTVEVYGHCLGRLLQYCDQAGRDPLQASVDELVVFTGIWLHRQGVQAIARGQYVAAVRGWYRWLAQRRHIKHNTAAAIEYPKAGRPLPRVMSLKQAERMMYAPDFNSFIGVRDGAMIALLLGCGLRVSGLVSLNQSAILYTDEKGERRAVIRVREKGDRERLLPVPREADLMLRVYLEHPELKAIDRLLPDGDQVLFVSVNNRKVSPADYRGQLRRISTRSVQDLLERYGKRAGLPREVLHPHAMRHLYGTELAESDVHLLLQQELLGHADPKTTRIYTHLAMRKKMDAADRGNPLAKIRTPAGDLLKRIPRAPR